MAAKRKRDEASDSSSGGSAAATDEARETSEAEPVDPPVEEAADDAVGDSEGDGADATTEGAPKETAEETVEETVDDALETEAIDDTELEEPPQVPMPVQERLPQRLVILPLDDMVFFPGMMLPILGQSDRSRATIQAALDSSKFIGLVAKHESTPDSGDSEGTGTGNGSTGGTDGPPDAIRIPETGPDGLYKVGTLGRIVQKVGTGSETGVIIAGIRRVRIRKWIRKGPVLLAEVDYPTSATRPKSSKRSSASYVAPSKSSFRCARTSRTSSAKPSRTSRVPDAWPTSSAVTWD